MSHLRIEFHPAADEEGVAAHHWYRERSSLAADRFLEELDAALARIQRTPKCGGHYLHGARCYLLRRFPYLIVYRETSQAIQVIAIAHGHRRPGYWKSRKLK
jgi:toxin ParE1/3/4